MLMEITTLMNFKCIGDVAAFVFKCNICVLAEILISL